MLFGTQQDNMKYVLNLLDSLDHKNLIIAPGCDMPYDIPPDNVIGVIETLNDPEKVRKACLGSMGILGLAGAVSGDVVGHAPGADGVRSGRGAGDIQGHHTVHPLPGDERAGVVDCQRRG